MARYHLNAYIIWFSYVRARIKNFYHQKQSLVAIFALVSITNFLFSQTPGIIIEPATDAAALVLDPNSNGYVSATTAGFLGNDQLLADDTNKIVDKKSGKVIFDGKTPGTSEFSQGLDGIKLNDELTYTITLSKEGYLTKVADFKHIVDKPGVINVHEKLDVSIGKVEIGTDLATLIDIKPIYFDLGKYIIRKDAAVELEKIVKVMNEYPSMVIQLGSHTDCRSSKDFNMKLSSNRAKASADYIKKKIKNPERIYGKGYGESKLKVNCPCEGAVKSNCSEEEHQKNRRTEFIIMKM